MTRFQNWHWVLLSCNWRRVFRGREYVDAISAFKVSFSAGYDSLGPRRSPHKMQPWTWMKCNEKCRSLYLSRNHSAKLAFFTGLFDTTSMQKQQTKMFWKRCGLVFDVFEFKVSKLQGCRVAKWAWGIKYNCNYEKVLLSTACAKGCANNIKFWSSQVYFFICLFIPCTNHDWRLLLQETDFGDKAVSW